MKSGNVRPKHVFAELEHSEHTKLMGICMWVSGHLGAITADEFVGAPVLLQLGSRAFFVVSKQRHKGALSR